MEKLLNTLIKPAKWVLIIGGLFYATWFAITRATSIDGNFISVVTTLIIMTIGTALLAAVPVLVLLKKDEIAKMVFLFLIGYWVLTAIQEWFFYAETFTDSRNGLAVTAGIFAFLAGLGIVAILVLTLLEFLLKKPSFRFISFMVLLGTIGIAFIGGLLMFIYSAINEAVWPTGLNLFVEFMILPVVIAFGYLYFFGSPKAKQ